ncbi:MAG: nitrogen fixation protein NifH [Candidatus Bathyarchaeota archaeon]|nr:nitrogen fixation protein NifH [Candidatus Bathyarchaeota archaeon]
MNDWKSALKADPTDWLLEPENPSVRYFTLTDILQKPPQSPQVLEAKAAIMQAGAVPKILARMQSGGYWETPQSHYTAKYKGSVWQLIILAELGADSADSRVQSACEFLLQNSQHLGSGGFSMAHSERAGGGRESGVIPCLTGNMVFSLIRLGYLDDSRVQKGIEWINAYQRFDDGEGAPKGWPYDKYVMCFGKHSCHMGAAKALKALSEIPAENRDSKTSAIIEAGAEYFLKHHIYKKSHDLNKVSKPGWLKFGFPLMYQTDALELLGILTKLGYKDERMQETVDLVVSKQDQRGYWKLESTFNGRFQTSIERKGEPSKWITLKALSALKRYYS